MEVSVTKRAVDELAVGRMVDIGKTSTPASEWNRYRDGQCKSARRGRETLGSSGLLMIAEHR